MDGKPTHEQAQLHLQVYDLRREARLRQARDWFAKNYIVNSLTTPCARGARNRSWGVRGDGGRLLGASLRVAQLRPPT